MRKDELALIGHPAVRDKLPLCGANHAHQAILLWREEGGKPSPRPQRIRQKQSPTSMLTLDTLPLGVSVAWKT